MIQEEGDEPVTKLVVIVEHPHGMLEMPLEEWIENGPGDRNLLRPTAIRRQSGERLPLTTIPLKYRNNVWSRLLISVGILADPWRK